MRTNEVIKLAEVSRDTLRYYEKIGLITPPVRQANGYREYSPQILEELKFIRLGQSLGFKLSDIKEGIPFLSNPKPGCPQLKAILLNQIEQVDSKIAELKNIRKTLEKWIKNNEKHAIEHQTPA